MDPITAFIVNLVIGVVLSVGSSLAANALSQTNRREETVRGFRGATQTGGTVPLSFLVGTIGVAGKLEYTGSWGNSGETPNAYLVDTLSLGDLTITGVTGLWANSDPVVIGSTGHVSQGYPVTISLPTGNDSSHLWAEFLDGSQVTAPTYLTAAFGSDPDRPWLSDMIGIGVPLLSLTALVDDAIWTGFPSYMVEAEGIPLVDPRLSTALGGDGPQDPDDPSTWAFTDNPIVIVYNILRGIHDNSLTVTTLGPRIWGGNATAYQLPYAEWAAAMDACDASINLVGGGTEKAYRGGREIFVNERPSDVIREFLVGANARISPSADGQYHILVGVPDAADGTFTDADLIVTEAATFDPFPALDQIVNGATGTYLERSQAWESKETSPYYRADLEAEDDNRRQLEGLAFGTTFSGTQAQRLLKAIVEDSRRFRRHVVVLPPAFAVYLVLNVLAWTSDENGYDGKLFLITARTLDPWGNVILGLQEIDPADYDWTPETDERPLSFAPMTPIRPAAQAMVGFAVSPYTFLGDAGEPRRPGILLEYTGAMPDIRAVEFQVREDFGDGDTVATGEITYDKTNINAAQPIGGQWTLPNTDYEVRARFLPPDGSGRPTDWSAWLGVTTPPVRLGPDDFYPIDTGGVADDIKRWMDRAANATREAEAAVQRLNLLGMEQTSRAILDQKTIREELRSEVDANTAAWTLAVETIATDNGAIAKRTETLRASVDGALATINETFAAGALTFEEGVQVFATAVLELETTVTDPVTGVVATATAVDALIADVAIIDGQVTANIAAITALEGVVGYDVAGAVFRIDLGYTPSAGWTSAIALQTRVNGSGTFRTSGIYLESTAAAARVVIDTDQLVVRAGGVVSAVFDAGTAYFATARIKDGSIVNAKIGNLEVDSAKIANLTIGTGKVVNNAINGWNGTKGAGATLAGSVTETTLHTFSATPDGGAIFVLSTFVARVTGGGVESVTFRLKRAGVTVDSLVVVLDDEPSTTIPLSYIDTSPGTSSITWTVTKQSATGVEDVEHSGVPIWTMNGKK